MIELVIVVLVLVVAARILFAALGFLIRLAVIAFLVVFALGMAHRHGLDARWSGDGHPARHSALAEPTRGSSANLSFLKAG